jgi:subtilisin family serine protease
MASLHTRRRRAAAVLLTGLLAAPLAPIPARAAAVGATPPEGVVLGTGSADAVTGRYIVVLKPGAAGTAGIGASAQALAASAQTLAASAQALAGDGVERTYRTLSGFTARLDARQARRLAADPSVALVEQDRIVRTEKTQKNPNWGLDRLDERSLPLSATYTAATRASGVRAYVIDTGIRIGHREFGGRATYGYDFVGLDRTAADCNGHGTHVAATIGGATYGVVKGVRLVAVRVLDCDGIGYLSDSIAGVDWVTENAVRPAVANMSLGGGYSAALDYAVEQSIDSGVTYAVAAGNESVDACDGSPADVPSALTVGATDKRDRRPEFSNYGSCVDIFAPGVGIRSATADSNTSTATWDGTSMATPHVAGAAAIVLAAHPAWTPARVRTFLVTTATTGKITGKGAGSPNRLLHTPAPPARAVVATTKLPSARVGRAYRYALTLGTARTGTWSLAGGTLPAGLRLSAAGVLSGTPTTAIARRVTFRFTDYVPQAVTAKLTIKVNA